jgi:hypothetical protein
VNDIIAKGTEMEQKAEKKEQEILQKVEDKM